MFQVALVALPSAWMAWLLGHVLWPFMQGKAALLWQMNPDVLAYAPFFRALGPLLVLAGTLLLIWELLKLRPWALAWDSVLIAAGALIWLLGCAYTLHGSWYHTTAVPVFSVLVFPAVVSSYVLLLLQSGEDDIGQTLLLWGLGVAAIAALHGWTIGW